MVRRLKNTIDSNLSPAEEALLAKFKTIKHHKALAQRRTSENLAELDSKKDARERAIDIIRARRAKNDASNEAAKPKPKLKIKLATVKPAPKPTKRKNTLIDDSDSDSDADVDDGRKDMPVRSSDGTAREVPAAAHDDRPSTSKPAAAEKKKRHVVSVKRRTQHPPSQQKSTAPFSTIFVDNLPEYVGKDELLRYFGVQNGLQVTGLHVFEGCASALVSFNTEHEAQTVLGHSLAINTQPLSARWATEEDIKASEGAAYAARGQDGVAPMDPRMATDPRMVGRRAHAGGDDEAHMETMEGPMGEAHGGQGYEDDPNDGIGAERDDGTDLDEDDPRARNVVDYFDL